MSSSWFLKDCTSESQAEEVVKNKAVGGFAIWPSPTIKGCLIYSFKKNDKKIGHLQILKEQNGFRIQDEQRYYPTLELVILGLRKSVLMSEPNNQTTNNTTNNNTNNLTPSPTPLSKEQEQFVEEVKEMFPNTNTEKIVRATTLAEGDKQKVIELLLTQKMENSEKKKQQHLCNVIVSVINDTKKRLVGYNKYINNSKKLSEVTCPLALQLLQNLSQIKKHLERFNAPEVEKKPMPTGDTPVAKIQIFKRKGIDDLKEIIAKLNLILNAVQSGKVPMNKLVHYGGIIRNIKQISDNIELDMEGVPIQGNKETVQETNSPSNSPQTTQNYIIDYNDLKMGEVIGKGAYGKVYRAYYEDPVSKTQRAVAVKSLAGLKDEKEKNWMKREINLLKQVKHPNVTEFIGISKSPEGHMLIVMELVSGGELYEKLLDEKLDMDWDLKLKIAQDVASALAYMHKRKLIHRDIKSENLLLDENWNTKLCDFGFARAIENRERTRMTMCGSPYFNAPELLLGKAYNDKVDVFAYGILLCEIITRGKVNLDRVGKSSNNAFALDVEAITKEIPKDCPPVFWKVALCCCNYEPEKRPTMMQVEKMITACRNLNKQK